MQDNTVRKKAEKKLREKNTELRLIRKHLEFYREVIETMAEGVCLIRTSDAEIVYTNPKFEKMFGYGPGELIGKHVSIVNAPMEKTPEETAKEIIQSIREKSIWSGEVHNIKKDGTLFWCHANASTFYHKDFGEVWIAVHQDISDRMQAEDALKEAHDELEESVKQRTIELVSVNEKLKDEIKEHKRTEMVLRESEILIDSFFVDAPAGFVIFDDQFRYIKINESLARAGRLSVEEHIGKSINEIIGDQLAQKIVPILQQSLKTGQPNINRKVRGNIFGEEGITRHWIFNAFPISWVGQNCVASVVVEITKQKQAEKALRESEEMTKALLNATTDSVFLIDTEGTVITMNKGIAKRLDRNLDEIIGRCIYDFLPADVAEIRKAKTDEVFKSGKHIRFTDQRTGMYLDNSIYPVFNTQGEVERAAVFARDITGQIRMEMKSRRQAAILAAINRVFLEALTCESDQEVARTCLSVAEELTGSKFGFIGELNPAGLFDALAISNSGWDACKMSDSEATRLIKNMKISGIDRSVLRDEEPRIVNEPASHPDRTGTPEGHPPITSFLGVPLKQAGKTIGMIGLGNKESDYDLADQEAIETLSLSFMEALNRKRSELALRESEEKYRSLVESTEDHIYLVDKNLIYSFLNEKYQTRFGLPEDEIIGRKYEQFHSNDETKEFTEKIEQIFEARQSLSDEYRSERDGKSFIRTLSPVKNQKGETTSVTVISKDITDRKQAEEALKTANENLLKEHNQRKVLSKRLIDLLEKDRYEIAMELHDHIGQVLTSLKINLEMIGSQLKPPKTELASQIKAAELKAIQALKDIKSISHGLKPSVLDALGLESSLRELYNEIQKSADMQVHFFSRNIPQRFGREKELAIYRVAQEAMTNVLKHSRATNIHVNLVKKDEMLSLSVEDDGVGFIYDEAAKISKWKGPLGLFIMRERITQLGGELRIESHPGKGTLVLAEIPI